MEGVGEVQKKMGYVLKNGGNWRFRKELTVPKKLPQRLIDAPNGNFREKLVLPEWPHSCQRGYSGHQIWAKSYARNRPVTPNKNPNKMPPTILQICI
ncbi:hypothetical protein H5410_050571 [Solanum commersonii]|uniref:Uncharacterized protein n=1 Tax=Solanum commersonii TaxID=4109 RepID=A0A9J5WYA4_SOLCO|nr:hypothetical protein H5410_050571 [Solanum commersonii]